MEGAILRIFWEGSHLLLPTHLPFGKRVRNPFVFLSDKTRVGWGQKYPTFLSTLGPMDRRVLIIENHDDFALNMASVLRDLGLQTTVAHGASEAQHELDLRRPDLVVVRAELPDQSGFVICANIKKGRFGQGIPVILLSSEVGHEGLTQHAQSPFPADAYLSMPFEMVDFVHVVNSILPADLRGADADFEVSVEDTADAAQLEDGVAPPPIPNIGPPSLPRRERRSAITDEDRAFLERCFQSIADRKAELLAESRQLKRPAPRRELMSSVEGKIALLREELKMREAQLARLSEIWSAREQELLAVEDRTHERDVEIQGLRLQVQDLSEKFRQSQATLAHNERQHGALVDELLLQKFVGEKEVIEVVSSKEKEVNILRREISNKVSELNQRTAELEAQKQATLTMEDKLHSTLLHWTGREQELLQHLERQDQTLDAQKAATLELQNKLQSLEEQHQITRGEMEASYQRQLDEASLEHENLRAQTLDLEQRVAEALRDRNLLREELVTLNQERGRLQREYEAHRLQHEQIFLEVSQKAERLESENGHLQSSLEHQKSQHELAIRKLEQELEQVLVRAEASEHEHQINLQKKIEEMGALEGEFDSLKRHAQERESEWLTSLAELEHAQQQQASELSGKDEELATQRREAQQLQEQLLALHTQAEQRRIEYDALNLAHGQLERRLEEMKSEVEGAKAEQERLLRQLSEKNSELEQALRDREDHQAYTQTLKEELGLRVSESTALSAQLALLEDKAASLQERMEQMQTQGQKREESLQQELAQVRLDLEQAHLQLSNLTMEKMRQAEAFSQEFSVREENFRVMESQFKADLAEVESQIELIRGELKSSQAEAKEAKTSRNDVAMQLAQVEKENAKLHRDHEHAKQELEHMGARVRELGKALQEERGEFQKALAEGTAERLELEKQFKEKALALESAVREREHLLLETQALSESRSKRVKELETALEASNAARIRSEKEASARAVSLEIKLQEAKGKSDAWVFEKRDLELLHQKKFEELSARSRLEFERREAIKAQEIQRLQTALQEKTKALRVLELELGRHTKPPPPLPSEPTRRPAPFSATPSLLSLSDEEEESTESTLIDPPRAEGGEEDWSDALRKELEK